MDEVKREQDLVAIERIFLPTRERRDHFIQELVKRDAEQWTPAVAKAWVEATADSHEEILEWAGAGWTLEEVEAVHILGQHVDAQMWRESGIRPDRVVAYVEAGVSIDEAERFRRDGDEPDIETLRSMAAWNRESHELRRETWAQRINEDDVW
jgi:hypothetical protein